MNTGRFLVRAKTPFGNKKLTVHGYYLGQTKVGSHQLFTGDFYDGKPDIVIIDLETLQGCTGTKDINGKLIFEGDKVKAAGGDDESGTIVWIPDEARYVVEWKFDDWTSLFDFYWEVVDE